VLSPGLLSQQHSAELAERVIAIQTEFDLKPIVHADLFN
jgi:hypothetical protein